MTELELLELLASLDDEIKTFLEEWPRRLRFDQMTSEAEIRFIETTYSDTTSDSDTTSKHPAVIVSLDDVAQLLGHAYGEAGHRLWADDQRIIEALVAAGAPEWVRRGYCFMEPTSDGCPTCWGVYRADGEGEAA